MQPSEFIKSSSFAQNTITCTCSIKFTFNFISVNFYVFAKFTPRYFMKFFQARFFLCNFKGSLWYLAAAPTLKHIDLFMLNSISSSSKKSLHLSSNFWSPATVGDSSKMSSAYKIISKKCSPILHPASVSSVFYTFIYKDVKKGRWQAPPCLTPLSTWKQ